PPAGGVVPADRDVELLGLVASHVLLELLLGIRHDGEVLGGDPVALRAVPVPAEGDTPPPRLAGREHDPAGDPGGEVLLEDAPIDHLDGEMRHARPPAGPRENGARVAVWWSDLLIDPTGAKPYLSTGRIPRAPGGPLAGDGQPGTPRGEGRRPSPARPSPHPADSIRRDLVDHPDLAGPSIRVAVLSEILLGQAIDMRVAPLLGDLDDAALDRQMAIGIRRINDRQGDGGVSPHVLVLHPTLGRVHPEELPVIVEPDGGHLGRPARHPGSQVSQRLLIVPQEVPVFLQLVSHVARLPCGRASSLRSRPPAGPGPAIP